MRRNRRTRRAYLSADEARGGTIVLRKGWQRATFLAGLFGALLLGFAFAAGAIN